MKKTNLFRGILTLLCLGAGMLPAAEATGAVPLTSVAPSLVELRQNERWDELGAAARQMLATNPSGVVAHAALVEALWREGRAPEAVAAADKAYALHADSADLRLSLASAWSLLARWPDVTRVLAPDLDSTTTSADALLLAGIALREQGQFDAARVHLQAVTQKYADDRRGWINLARLEVAANRPAQVIAALQHLPAGSAEVLYLTARAQSMNGQTATAISTITSALGKAPQRASFYTLRASLLANLQEWPAAARDIHSALLLGAWAAEDYLLACEAARMLGDRDALAAYARAGLAAHPNRVEFPLQLARALREQGNTENALTLLIAAQQAFPDNTTLILETAISQSALGRDTGAVTTLNPLLARQPLAQAYAMRAYAYLRLGQQVRADEDAANALALDPDQVNALLVQTRVALMQNQTSRAAISCQRALSRAPTLAWAYTTCSEVALAQDKTADARRLVERALLLSPQDAEALQLRKRLDVHPASTGDQP